MKRYKIAFVVNQFPSVSETFILNQITDMVERGHEVKIYSFKKKRLSFIHQAVERYNLLERTTYFKYPPHLGSRKATWFIRFVSINFINLLREPAFKITKPGSIRRAIRNLFLSHSVTTFLKSIDFDIVHAHFGQRGAIIANLMAKGKLGGFKFVTSFHGYDLNPLFTERYKSEYRNLFLYADGITVNSPYLGDILIKVCPQPKNLTLMPEGLRTEQYKKQPLEQGAGENSNFTIVFCGRFVEFKAPDLAVRIMDILVNRRGLTHLNLRMVGDGKLRKEVERLIQESGLKKNVFMLGALSQEQVIQEMNCADLFLLPGIQEKETGRAETQGLVIQEAQAMELPVVVSDAGGMKYGLLDGATGFVVKEGAVDIFADKIELLSKDKALRLRMGKNGREFVVKHFDTKILGDKLLDLYSRI